MRQVSSVSHTARKREGRDGWGFQNKIKSLGRPSGEVAMAMDCYFVFILFFFSRAERCAIDLVGKGGGGKEYLDYAT